MSGTVSVDDSLDDVEARWCVAIAQAHHVIGQGASDVDVRKLAAQHLIPDSDLHGALSMWSGALDVAAHLQVPMAALFHRLRWLTPEERERIGAPMPIGWPPHPVWRFYRVMVMRHARCAGRSTLRIAS